jgi:hypothetical protein
MWNPLSSWLGASPAAPRRRLLRDLLLLLAVTCGGLLAAVFFAGESLRDELAREQLQELSRKISEEFAGFFSPAEKALLMARGWGAAGQLNLDDPAALSARFIPVLQTMPKASALVIGDSDGRSYYLSRDGEAWLSRSLDADGRGSWQLWTADGSRLAEHEGRADFDPRLRPWFKGALDAAPGQVFWTRPYLFHTSQLTGLTGAIGYAPPRQPEQRQVLGLDLPLNNILDALASLRVGDRGQAFLTETDGGVLLPNTSGAEPGGFPVTLPVNRFDAGPVVTAVRAWLGAGRPANQPLSLTSDGHSWWAWLQPVGQRQELWLGITLPETDFLGALQRGWALVLLVGVAVLAAGLVLIVALTRRWGRQLRAMPSLADDPASFAEKLLALIREGESPTLEFKSTLRTNLQSGKPGKEIELAWLKGVVGFLNSDGGTLLIGVNDAGEVVGLAADAFENEDKCLLHFKNLINQHIGAEYSRHIQGELRTVADSQILVVCCERADGAVFLKVGKNEEFHIRSGPSSMKLTPRQMLHYLSTR